MRIGLVAADAVSMMIGTSLNLDGPRRQTSSADLTSGSIRSRTMRSDRPLLRHPQRLVAVRSQRHLVPFEAQVSHRPPRLHDLRRRRPCQNRRDAFGLPRPAATRVCKSVYTMARLLSDVERLAAGAAQELAGLPCREESYGMIKPESTEGGRRVSILKSARAGALLNLG